MARLGYNGYAADMWSLGVCLFGLVAGFFPVDEASNRDWRYERLARHQHVHPDRSTCDLIFSFYERKCPLSPALKDLLDRMLQVAPSRRAQLTDIATSAWVRGHSTLPLSAPPKAAAEAVTLPMQQLIDMDITIDAAVAAPPATSEPSVHQVEIDICDFLQRSAADADAPSADGDAMEYRSMAASGGGAMEPPRICRQRAEDSVGMLGIP